MREKADPGSSAYFVVILAILAAVFTVYWQIPEFEFLNFDDPLYVTGNAMVTEGLNKDSIVWAFTARHASNWHPLTWLSHMLDCTLFGVDPGKHHLVNLVYHAANAVLLFLFLALASRRFWRSALVGLLFALHPQHVEPVVWISERKEVLSVFCMLLSLFAYWRFSLKRRGLSYCAAVVLFAAGLMSKPMLVSFPLLLLCVDYWPLGRWRNGEQLRPLLVEKIPFLSLSLLSAVATFWVQEQSGAVKSLQMIPIALRIKNACISSVIYVQKTIWPTGLLLPYPFPSEISLLQALGSLLLLTAGCVFVLRVSRRHPYLLFGWFWFLIALIPVIGFVQVGVQAMADRYTYLPHIGLFVCLVWGAAHLLERQGAGKTLLTGLSGVVLAALALQTVQQAAHWRSSESLFQHAVVASSQNYTAHAYLALALAGKNRLDEAAVHYEKAVSLKPDYVEALVNYGVVKARQADYAQGFVLLSRALELDPQNPKILNNMGNVVKGQGDLSRAVAYYQQAITLQPDYTDALFNLAATFEKLDRFEEAMGLYQKIFVLVPGSAEAHNGLGVALARSGRLQEARDSFQRALDLRGDYEKARTNLQLAEALLQQAAETKQGAREVLPDAL